MKKNDHKILALILLLAIGLVGTTWAVFNQSIIVENTVKTAKYKTVLNDEIKSTKGWVPGTVLKKNVSITNDGTYPFIVSIKIKQSWSKSSTELSSLSFDNLGKKEYLAQISWADVRILTKDKKSDIDLGIKTVEKIEDARDKWLLVSDEPNSDGEFKFYYIGLVEPNATTSKLMYGVRLNPAIKPEIISFSKEWDDATNEYSTKLEKNIDYNFAGAKYTMDISGESVQATKAGVAAIFTDLVTEKPIVDYLISIANTEKF